MEEGVQKTRRRLPHWRLENAVYFVTWRLHRSQALLSAQERSLVAGALKFFNRQRYRLLAFVVMDDHVHVILQPWGEHTLSKILHSWKSFTAHKLISQRGTPPPFWQDESMDRIIRDQEDLDEKMGYIFNNPTKRWPGTENYPWLEWFAWEDS